ncbi:MAG: ribbon-helix-helix protein, CopG family [Candidatus Krumholzibacteriia bacterium]
MKIAISLPDQLYAAADRLARRLGVSRSELYRRALADYLERHDDESVTRQLDAVYGDDPDPGVPGPLDRQQRRGVSREDW